VLYRREEKSPSVIPERCFSFYYFTAKTVRFVRSAADVFARLQLAQFARIAISRCVIAGEL